MQLQTTCVALLFAAAMAGMPVWAQSLAVDEPLTPNATQKIRPTDLLVAERNGELAVDEPLDANASQKIRPTDYLIAERNGELTADEPLDPNPSQKVRPVDDLIVDRNYDLFADERPTHPPGTRPPVAAPAESQSLLYRDADAPQVQLAAARVEPAPDAIVFDREAKSLDAIEQGRTVARWFATLETADGPTRFGELVTLAEDGDLDLQRPTVPLIGRVRGVADAVLQITDPTGRGNGWVYVAAGSASGELWGVLDAIVGEPNPQLTLVHSTDAGRSWQVRPLQKPAPQAEFATMLMNAAGQGSVFLYLPSEQGGLQPGYYPFTTTDAGKTWTAEPRRDDRPDALSDRGLRDALPSQAVSGSYYGGTGTFHCYRPIYRPYGRRPQRPTRPNPDANFEPAPEVRGRLKALENPGLDDRMERGKVPARFDVSPK